MISVTFLGPIDEQVLQLDVKNLRELKEALQKIPAVNKWLHISAVAVNDAICENLDTELKSGDKVVILPPVCGG
ncbi:molybdopterin synthase sulfur carrier subunit [Helicobacter sp. 13S00401-1]|uniref:MoaD/ThiS family protein n=1 Tax=Helicobacter sp. 13S00401-1 TaxID=1905758 RepID=UPI000BA7B9CD|nr:MoaD/ThiS family protein [Helicobacter sp. 13S00401-1]PAF51778.1 molybdopterin synthase sulfur carrier subunit [Helicobacter sp. 13S00401-1]